MNQTTKFKVGQIWSNRDNSQVTVVSVNDKDKDYPIECDNGLTYTSSGFYIQDDTSYYDLVDLIKDVDVVEPVSVSLSDKEFFEEHKIKQKDNVISIYAKEQSGYHCNIKGEKLFKLTDTGNGYISKQYNHSPVVQDNYLCMDYSEAEYLYYALQVALGKGK